MANRIFRPQPLDANLAALLLRLTFGGMFIQHGYLKLSAYKQMLAQFPDIIGIGSTLSLNLVIFAEFFCGIFILVGFLTRLSVIPIFITMIVVFFIAHAKDPFIMKLLPFVYLLLCFVIFVMGSGKYSVDNLLFNRNRRNDSY